MATNKISTLSKVLKKSLEQLNSIAQEAYNDDIRDVALSSWKKQLSPKNPQWKFLTFKSFSLAEETGSAHVMAMLDERLPGKGLVGYFACTNSDSGAKVLEQACDWLSKNHKISDVYGPINGTLPNDYRLNLEDDFSFPGEPVNPKWHLDSFEKAGFSIFNRYESGKLKHFNFWLWPTFRKSRQLTERYDIRPFNSEEFDADFETYHELRNLIFPFQSIYCPAISLEERIYNSSGKFDAKYTYFLTDNGREVGFVMAYIYEQQLVLKTIGLLPDYRGKGLSNMLLSRVHKQASNEGVNTAIYGMVRVGNGVHKNKHPMAKAFRRYVTMHKKI